MNRRGDSKDSRRSSGGKAVKDYLLGKDNDRENARLLQGDPELTTEIINGLDFKKLYTSGTLAFDYGEGDKLSEQDKQDIIDSFEQTLFPNLEPNQFSGYWVEHTDKVNDAGEQRLELNFVFASVELTSGKALPVYYHRNDKHLTNAWRDFTVAKYELADPNAHDRKRVLSTVKDLPSSVKELREQLHEFITLEIEQGNINDRSDIVKTLTDAGIEVARETDKSISIKNPNSKRNIRLSGAIYEREFTSEKLVRDYSASEKEQSRTSAIDIDAARERLQYSVEKRAERLSQRFQTTENRHDERVRKIADTSIRERSEIADTRNRFSNDTRYSLEPSPFKFAVKKQNSHAASQHNERVTKDSDSSVWSHANADALSTASTRLQLQNMATLSDSFISGISEHWHSLRADADASTKRGLDNDSRAATTRHAQTDRARATQSSEHSLRPARERTESFSKAVAAELIRYAQRTDNSITDATDNARRSIDRDKESEQARAREPSRRSDIAEQTSRLLDNAITEARRSNARLEQQQQVAAAQKKASVETVEKTSLNRPRPRF